MSVTYGDLTFDRLGHASIRIETGGGKVVYVDPWSQVLDDEPHDADVVFVTHDDADHYDAGAIQAVSGDDTTVVVYDEVDASDLGREVTTIGMDETTVVEGIEVHTVPAYNRSDGEHVDENGDPFHAEGEVIGLLLTFDETTVYFTSDTDFLDVHEDLHPDVLVPPIGGHFTMDRHEAADLAEALSPELVLPVHYDTFEQIQTDVDAFVADVETRGPRVEPF
jgi:L-ascorbate metabolism protein UlaG (beta-lactamase superfamily)